MHASVFPIKPISAVAALNGNGKQDIVTLSRDASKLNLIANGGAPLFAARRNYLEGGGCGRGYLSVLNIALIPNT